ncbi:MAG: trigger factor [Bacteroidetes bacterium]|nr:trigger factor [Bacteroidota bacterium]
MNLSKENTGELTATIRLEIIPEDYSEQVNKVIRDYQKKANIPGFRPGHIPSGLIRKMYGKAVLAEEVNKLISDSLTNYIKEQKLDLLGNPIPNQEKNSAVNFETQTSFEFFFDIGFAPEFKIPFGPETEVEDLEIIVDDSMIDKYVDETRKRFGTPVKAEESELPVGSVAAEVPATDEDIKPATKTPEVIPAEMTTELFEKVYPGDKIENEEQFRERIRKDASASFAQETDRIFFNKATDILVKSTNFDLPDEFLKRWLLEYNEGKFTQEQIEKDYTSFRESMKWQLIENRIIRDNNIKVSDEDIRHYIRTVMLQRVGTEFVDPEMEKKYESIVDAFMQNKEQVQRINDQLYNARMLGLFKTTLNIVKKEVSYDEFIKIASEMHEHDHSHHDHEHEHEHDHEHEHEHE